MSLRDEMNGSLAEALHRYAMDARRDSPWTEVRGQDLMSLRDEMNGRQSGR